MLVIQGWLIPRSLSFLGIIQVVTIKKCLPSYRLADVLLYSYMTLCSSVCNIVNPVPVNMDVQIQFLWGESFRSGGQTMNH